MSQYKLVRFNLNGKDVEKMGTPGTPRYGNRKPVFF